MQKNKTKSLLIRLLTVICALCCCLSLAFGLAGCGDDGKTISSASINDKGELVLVYTDGTSANLGVVKGDKGDKGEDSGKLDANCAHAFSSHVVQFATCVQEGITLDVCSKCGGFKTVIGEKNANVHGTYSYMELTGGPNGEVAKLLVLDTTCLEIIPGTDMEEANGACQKKYCKLCETYLTQHGELVDYPVDENANACEEEHLVVSACKDCNAFVTEPRLEGATGHEYEIVESSKAKVGTNYEFIMKCATCGEYLAKTTGEADADQAKAMKVVATPVADKSVVATCSNGGYTTFAYSFNNYVEEISKEFVADRVEANGLHVIGEGQYKQNAVVHYNDELAALLEAGTIEWFEGTPNDCEVPDDSTATFDCEVCKKAIAIKLTGEHDYAEASKLTCVADSIKTCEECGHDETVALAEGHEYEFKSYDKTTGKATAKCANCTYTVEVAATFVEKLEAENCESATYDLYTMTIANNGLASSHVNYAADIEIEFEVVDETAPRMHTLTDEFKYAQNSVVDFLPEFKALVEAGTIEWFEGEAQDCTVPADSTAQFYCTVCEKPVAIKLTGEHTLDAEDTNNTAAGCTTRGINRNKCTACDQYIVTGYEDAKGHTIVADTADWNAFVADPANNKTVTFTCACGAYNKDLTATVTTASKQDDCVKTDTTTYTFTDTYDKQLKNGEFEEVEFEKIYEVKVVTGSHKIGDLTNLVQNGVVHYSEKVAALIEAGKIEWFEGKPNNCQVPALSTATFDCEVCNKAIAIKLTGEHTYGEASEVTCTEDSVRICSVCNHEDVVQTKLGHAYSYEVTGATATNPGVATGTCTRTGCNHTVTVNGVEKDRTPENCGKNGVVVYEYKDAAGQTVAPDKEVTLLATGLHDNQGGAATQVEFIAGGYKYTCYFCEVCETYVVISKTEVTA